MKIKSLFLFALLSAFLSNTYAQSKPNVIMIYTDDHRYSGVGAFSQQALQTPNIDDLAADGISFSNAYLQGSFTGATCVPSRAMLQTGRNLFELNNLGRTIPEDQTTQGEAFIDAGYISHMVGKWHQDKPSLKRTFNSGGIIMSLGAYLVDHYRMPLWDWNKKGAYPQSDAYLVYFDEEGKQQRRNLNKKDVRGPIGTEEFGPHTSELFAEDAISFINSYRKKKPYYMYLAFHAPHDPRQAPKEYQDMYPPENIVLPPSYLPQHPFDNGHQVLRDEELAPWPRTESVAKKHLGDYYAIITHLDAQIGRVIQALKETGQYENTIIVLAGDSGLGVGCHGLMGKQNIYNEDGIHIPLIFSGGPVKDKGREIDALCYTHDIFPTICDLAGIEIPTSVSGLSQAPVIHNELEFIRDHTYHAYMQFQRAYRKGDYKLIEYVRNEGHDKYRGAFIAGSRVTQLYNINKDPWEVFNLAYFPEYVDIVAELRMEMKKEAIKLNDTKEAVSYDYDYWDKFD